MEDFSQAVEKIVSLMRMITTAGWLNIEYRITADAGVDSDDHRIYVECEGPDAERLLDHDGELLLALEHIATQVLRLKAEEHYLISFDSTGFKAAHASLHEDANSAIDSMIISHRK